ncbi:MAG: L,D-transpeptidase family protein [Microbacterium sp.]
MTDLATKPMDTSGDGPEPPVEWAPAEPEKKKRHLGWWIGVPSALVVAGAAVCSLILIAPGTVVAGANVGLHTAGSAAEKIATGFDATEVTIKGEDGDVTLSAADLGLHADAQAAANDAFTDYPLWKVGEWNPGDLPVQVTIDPEIAQDALVAAAPEMFTDPVDAQVTYSEDDGKFTVVEATPGTGIDFDQLVTDITAAVSTGSGGNVTVTAEPSSVDAAITTEDAQAEADSLNTLVSDVGFYIGDDEAVDVDAKTAASWLDVTVEDGAFHVTVDKDAVQKVVDTLPDQVNRDVVDKEVVTNSSGDELRVLQEGQDGWGLNSTDGIADEVASQLTDGSGHFELNVEDVAYETTTYYRHVDANLTTGTVTLYEQKNDGEDAVVATMPFASGLPGHDTQTGHFTVYAQLASQNMGDCTADGEYAATPGSSFDYCTADVKWISYFNGDQGFHGTYWHSDFGIDPSTGVGWRKSHGCINLSEADALTMYKFLQVGSEVYVHS